MYAARDLERLEQIVALRFLGLPLKQIRILLDRDVIDLREALRIQRVVLTKKRHLLDRAIEAIADAESILQSGKPASAAALKRIIEAIRMQSESHDATEFMKNYYREEAWRRFHALHREWPSHAWNDLFGDVAAALTENPESQRAQALAARWKQLRMSDSGGDPRIHAGLLKAWNDREYWPDAIRNRFAGFPLYEISQFIARAFGAYRRKNFGDIVWIHELDSFTPEEKNERAALAMVDLSFKIEAARDRDPAGEAGQALAARWLELIESRTGSFPPGAAFSYESHLRWMDSWPPALHQRMQTLKMEEIGSFILQAMAHSA